MTSKKITAAITAVGGYVPEDKLTNFDLEKMVDTNDEWIRTRTGISERRILKGEGKATSDLVVPAVRQLCEKRGISPEEIDCLIVGTVTPDMVFLLLLILHAINLEPKMPGALMYLPPVRGFYIRLHLALR